MVAERPAKRLTAWHQVKKAMSMPTLSRDHDVYVINLGHSENALNPDSITEVSRHLDEIAGESGSRALVMTATGKFFSNGADMQWGQAHPDQSETYAVQMHGLLARLLALPVPTVAAIGGHAFGAGALLALSADFRVMRADRGFWCLPEVDLHIPFSRAASALIQSRLSKRAAHEAMTTGRRYGGPEALEAGIVDAVAPEDELMASATELAGRLAGKAGATLGTIKEGMYAKALGLLRETSDPLALTV
jgi:enoyl-CoA hydratase/carnithine racemase